MANMKPVELEKVHDGKGFAFTVGNNWKYTSGFVFNGQIWGLYVFFGRLFSFSFWEKDA